MDSNTYGYLYQPPSIPKNWNADEKRFFNQLMELFDRLFSMKLGETRLKNGAVTASKIAFNALDNIDLVNNKTFIPVIDYLGEDNIRKAVTGVTLDQRLVTKVEDLEQGTELLQGVDSLQVNVADLMNKIGTYFKFNLNGLEIGKVGEEYHTETTNDGFYIVKGAGNGKVIMVAVNADETKMPAIRAQDSLVIGRPENGCLEWVRCFNGYGLRHIAAS